MSHPPQHCVTDSVASRDNVCPPNAAKEIEHEKEIISQMGPFVSFVDTYGNFQNESWINVMSKAL